MGIQHRNLTDTNMHEPKGFSTAPSGSVYASDGAGSGYFTSLGGYTSWNGPWATGVEYPQSSMVTDTGWLMISNKTTSDRAAPQATGVPRDVYSGTIGSNSATVKQLIFGNRYTFPKSGYLTGYRLNVIAGNVYTIYTIIDPTGTPIIQQRGEFTATTTAWKTFNTPTTIVGAGSKLDLVVVAREPDPTPTTWTGDWNYTNPKNAGAPGAGVIIHSDDDPQLFEISKTDNALGDRTAELVALTIGDTISALGVTWAIQGIIDSGTYMTFGVAPAVQGNPEGVTTFTFETVTATPITYAEDPTYWTTSGISAQGLYIADGEYGDIVPNDTAYGVDITVQDATVSPDWDFMAYSGGS